jgi:outer membrane protein TolC
MLLGGCVSAGPVRNAELGLPTTFEEQTGTLSTRGLDRWWLMFNDAQLTMLVDNALARSTDARAAAARLREARAIRRGALASFGPQGNLNAGAQAQGTEILAGGRGGFAIPGGGSGGGGGQENPFSQEGITYSANSGFDVSWEVDLFGRRKCRSA